MTNSEFTRLCKGISLYKKTKLNTTDTDIFFMKGKTKGERRINFEQFCNIMSMIDEKLGGKRLVDKLVKKPSKKLTATKAETDGVYSRLTDQKNYTGVYKRGGPKNVDRTNQAFHMNRNEKANVRGVLT
jgi:hypothetical protein